MSVTHPLSEPISRAISAYEHAAAEAERRAEAHAGLIMRDAGHQIAAEALRRLSETMRECANSLRPRSDLASAIKDGSYG